MGEDKAHKQYRGRLAPTPSGYLHEGHVQTFRSVCDRSRANKGRIVFRMDDLDLMAPKNMLLHVLRM